MTVPFGFATVAAMQPLDPRQVFRRAIHDLAEEPTPENVVRYLAASRLLERGAIDGRTKRAGRRPVRPAQGKP
jgi:hypothetical protein